MDRISDQRAIYSANLTGGITFFAHVGGFALGLIAGFLFRGRAGQLEFEGDRGRPFGGI